MMVQALVLRAARPERPRPVLARAVLATLYGLGSPSTSRPAGLHNRSRGPARLPNAVALNSVVFNGARIVGPGVAGS